MTSDKENKNLAIAWGTVGALLVGCLGLSATTTKPDTSAQEDIQQQNEEFVAKVNADSISPTVDMSEPAVKPETSSEQSAVAETKVEATAMEASPPEPPERIQPTSDLATAEAPKELPVEAIEASDLPPSDSSPPDSGSTTNGLASTDPAPTTSSEPVASDATSQATAESVSIASPDPIPAESPTTEITKTIEEPVDSLTTDSESPAIADLASVGSTADVEVAIEPIDPVEAAPPALDPAASSLDELTSPPEEVAAIVPDAPPTLSQAADAEVDETPDVAPITEPSIATEDVTASPIELPSVPETAIADQPSDEPSETAAPPIETASSPLDSPETTTSPKPFLGVGIREPAGSIVTTIWTGSTASTLGVKLGDQIKSVNDKPVKDLASLAELLKQMGVGDNATLKVMRKGELITLGPRPLLAR